MNTVPGPFVHQIANTCARKIARDRPRKLSAYRNASTFGSTSCYRELPCPQCVESQFAAATLLDWQLRAARLAFAFCSGTPVIENHPSPRLA